MNINQFRVAPKHLAPCLIRELPIEEVFAETEKVYSKWQGESVNSSIYGPSINIGNPRYHLLNKTRQCECCGIIGNRIFLCEDPDNNCYNLNLFGETRDRPNSTPHLVLLTQDHIIPKRDGGSDELSNLRCLCILCNELRDNSGLDIRKMQIFMFSAYRIYRGSLTNRLTCKNIDELIRRAAKLTNMVNAITAGLSQIRSEEQKERVSQKLIDARCELHELNKQINEALITSQTSGIAQSYEKGILTPIPFDYSNPHGTNNSEDPCERTLE